MGKTGLGRSGWAEAGGGLAAAVEVGVVGVDAVQGQGRVAAGRYVLFVAGRRRVERDLSSERGAGAGGVVEDGVSGQAEAAGAETSAAVAKRGENGGHRGELGGRRRRERVATGETWVVGCWVRAAEQE